MSDKAVQEVLTRIDALAAKLGVTSEHVWRILVQQARVECFESAAWGALWLGVAVVTWRALRAFRAGSRYEREQYATKLQAWFQRADAWVNEHNGQRGYGYRTHTDYEWATRDERPKAPDDDTNSRVMMFSVALTAGGGLLGVTYLTGAVSIALNPEYWALREILRVLS
jgi:hypothetical protein